MQVLAVAESIRFLALERGVGKLLAIMECTFKLILLTERARFEILII